MGKMCCMVVVGLMFGLSALPAQANDKLKVFILAGQSNMEGHAKIATFDYLADDPATVPLLKKMRDAEGKPRVRDDVWISYLTGSRDQNGEGFGPLTAGYGSRPDPAQLGGENRSRIHLRYHHG